MRRVVPQLKFSPRCRIGFRATRYASDVFSLCWVAAYVLPALAHLNLSCARSVGGFFLTLVPTKVFPTISRPRLSRGPSVTSGGVRPKDRNLLCLLFASDVGFKSRRPLSGKSTLTPGCCRFPAESSPTPSPYYRICAEGVCGDS